MLPFEFSVPDLPPQASALREEVRRFLSVELATRSAESLAQSWVGFDAGFSARLGEQGWIGMTWPREYGGGARCAIERHIVLEELLAAGAPVGAHWIADRQSGALLLRFGSPQAREKYLPRMARGELFFCIGMSEPGAGSDLAAVRTRATRAEGGWRVNGSKLWTTNVDRAHVMIALVRTGEAGASRHEGLTQLLVELDSPGVSRRAITDQTGHAHFGEVFFSDVFVPDTHLLGAEGQGWQQVGAELALERSGPERFLSTYRLLEEFVAASASAPSEPAVDLIGRSVAELWTLRQMSLSVADRLARGANPALEATIVKDLGTSYEQRMPHEVQAIADEQALAENEDLAKVLRYLLKATPSFSLRGGTREILRGIIARGLGLR